MLLRPILDILAPPFCAGCGSSAGAVEPLCAVCRGELRWLGSDPADAGGIAVWAPLAYEGPARGVVCALKFRGASRVATAMAAQIAANAPPRWLESPSSLEPPGWPDVESQSPRAPALSGPPPAALVPVPLHPARARKRGYNQAALLAAAIAERTGLPTCDCLERAGPQRTQVGRDRVQRLAGIAGSVRLAPQRAPPARAVLVDDVITTGATLDACARALLESGVADLRAVAYARTPGR